MFHEDLMLGPKFIMQLLASILSVLLLAQNPDQARLPVPEMAEVDAAKMKIREVLATEYKDAKTPAATVALAERMAGRAADLKESPANRFAFFVEARELYVDVGDFLAAFKVIDSISMVFDQPPFAQKIDLVQRAAKVAKSSTQFRSIVAVSLKLAGEAADGEDYAVAKECCQTAVASARASSEPALQTRAIEQLRRYEKLYSEWESAAEALKILKDQPDDGEANLRLGRYRCLVRRDWTNGRTALAKSADAELAGLATRDLTDPTTPDDQLGVGEAWLKYAEKQKGPLRRRLPPKDLPIGWKQQSEGSMASTRLLPRSD